MRAFHRGLTCAGVIAAVLAFGGASSATASPPTATPTGLHVSSVSARTITVMWDPSSDPALAPVVFFDDAERSLDWLSPWDTDWTSPPQMCGTPHTIGVAYVYNEGNLSEVGPVAWVSQRTSACTGPPPSGPTGLRVVEATGSSLTVGWDPPADADVEAIKVSVFGPPFWFDDGNFDSPTAYRRVTGGVCGTQYRFEAIFRDTEGQLSPVASFTGSTDDCASLGPAPDGPPELRVVSSTSTSAVLGWDAATNPDVTRTRLTVSGPDTHGEQWLGRTATTRTVSTPRCGSAYTVAVTWLLADGRLAVPATVTLDTPACPPAEPLISGWSGPGPPIPAAPTTPIPTTSAPTLSLRLPAGQSLRTLRSKGLLVKATCSAACRIDARLLLDRVTARKLHIAAPVTIARASGSVPARGTTRLTFRLTRRARAGLARVRTVRLTLRTTVRGNGQQTTQRRLTLTRTRATLGAAQPSP
jgi:hypothetical protein